MLERVATVLGELPPGAFPFPDFALCHSREHALTSCHLSPQLEERDPSNTDPEQMGHVQELMSKLDAAGVVASAGAEEGGEANDDWEDASEDEAMEE